MDAEVLSAIIGGSAAIIAALIGLITVQRGSGRSGGKESKKSWHFDWRRLLHPSKNTKTLALVAVVIIALAFIIFVMWPKPSDCRTFVPLAVTSSTEKDELLGALMSDYARNAEARDGICAQVTVSNVSSGDAMEGLVNGWGSTQYTNGKPTPQVWLPTSSMWVSQYQRLKSVQVRYSPITRSRLVIAMPRSIAYAIGWPGKPMSWKDLRSLATSTTPWQLYPGLPPQQPFAIRKDNPKYSTSGLASTVAAYYAGNRQLRNSTDLLAAVSDEAVINYVRSLESGVEYTHDVMDLLTNLGQHDAQGKALDYLSGIVMQEQLVYLYNGKHSEVFHNDKPESLKEPLHIFYPEDGLLQLDHPYVVLSSDPAVVNAAESFRQFLLEEEQQQRFMEIGFRHVGTNALAPSARTIMNIPSGPVPAYTEEPSAEALIRILNDIDRLRRKARVLLVLDVSGSMRDRVGDAKPKHQLVQDAVKAALAQLNPYDEVGLMVFSDKHTQLVEVGPLATVRDDLVTALDNLPLGGRTALYDTVRAATAKMATPRELDWVNAVVVLTDGEDTAYPGREAETQALAKLGADLQQSEHNVPVYTIGFGLNTSPDLKCEAVENEDPVLKGAREALKAISDASFGSCFNAAATGPSYINKVFVDVFRHF